LGDRKNHVMLLSFQAEDTIGRKLKDGAKNVVIDEENVKVKAKITSMGCFSSHADNDKLLDWVSKISSPMPKKIFIIHGENDRREAFSNSLKNNFKGEIFLPEDESSYEI